ncbi:DUP family protein [Prochlorococcus sp. MIT 1223]|uniref:DUP family protein n=1 Tax=Prochlorococcus sp. MIT 1223 TaxID=3096217 RepID=UPI002A74BE07|nr:DUP family protein [Prochlorococcus sp. MIT 1223]
MLDRKKAYDPFGNISNDQIADIVNSNNELDDEAARFIQEERDEEKRLVYERKYLNRHFLRLRKSPLEIINRSLLLFFLVSFIFSFIIIFRVSNLWFCVYILSTFSCVFYTPNRKTIKELISAWPNIQDLLSKNGLWK